MGKRGHSRRGDSARVAGGGVWRYGGEDLPQTWISQQPFYLGRKKYAGLSLSELRELRQLLEENANLNPTNEDLSVGSRA